MPLDNKGDIKFKNGDNFSGTVTFNGTGTLKYKNGSVYTGGIKNS